MAKDYAIQQHRKGRRRSQSKRNLLKITLLVLIILFLVYGFQHIFQNINRLKTVPTKAREEKTRVSLEAVNNSGKVSKPRFEFYTILPSLQVSPNINSPVNKMAQINSQKDVPEASKNSKAKITEDQSIYFLQLASFRNLNDAKNLAEELKQKGFTVQITKIEYKQSIWFRVQIGPFSQYIEAQKANYQLGELKYKAVFIKKSS